MSTNKNLTETIKKRYRVDRREIAFFAVSSIPFIPTPLGGGVIYLDGTLFGCSCQVWQAAFFVINITKNYLLTREKETAILFMAPPPEVVG